MRGSTAKMLKDQTLILYRTATLSGEIPVPESPEEMRAAIKRLHRHVKKRWKKLSEPEKTRMSESWRKSNA